MAKEAITHSLRTRGYPKAGKASAWQAKKVKVCALNKNTATDQVGRLTFRLNATRRSTAAKVSNMDFDNVRFGPEAAMRRRHANPSRRAYLQHRWLVDLTACCVGVKGRRVQSAEAGPKPSVQARRSGAD